MGIPMGFHLQDQDRWKWVYDKFFSVIQKWKGYQPSLSSFVLNHYILPCLVYYLAFWKPTKTQMKSIHSLTGKFLWGSSGDQRTICKVSLRACVLPKSKGGLGLLNLEQLASKLAAKWIAKSIDSEDFWAVLIKRSCHLFSLEERKSWTGFSAVQIYLSPIKFSPKGSPLVCNMWNSWNNYKHLLITS